MKNIILMTMLLGVSAATAQTTDNPPYIEPVTAEGVAIEDARVHMTDNGDGTYSADNVVLDHGLRFIGASSDGTYSTYYSMPGWAVSPAVEGWPNPLSISTATTYIPVYGGTYDVTFDPARSGGNRTFTITPVSGELRAPGRMFLLLPDGTQREMTASAEDGVFSLPAGKIPEKFRVTYEPSSSATYVLGPEDAATAAVALWTQVALGRGVNAGYTFAYEPTALPETDELRVTVAGGHAALTLLNIVLTGVEDVKADDAEAPEWYDLSGRPAVADRPGVYIDARTHRKVLVR